MKAIILVGEQGRGKTTAAMEIINNFSKKDLFVYDINGDYGKFANNKIKGLPSMEQFLNITETVKNSVIVFEESTIFFSNKARSETIVNLLVRNFHTKNVVVFLFHSVRSIPVDIMDFVQFIQIFHTNDRYTLIANKFRDDGDLLEVFNDVYTKTYQTEKNRDTGVYTDDNSKEFYHYSRVYSR